ncbi:hypothetical protein D1224_00435 [Henriciella barbarensis]|uniref:Uncharacterized protein n=1 Tax=Henriciella barbarensis TaxID=86342 RepID=A0A399R6J4_9PROT|nr:hypothetical protein D1224_00435 [Henriciella barbarensis]
MLVGAIAFFSTQSLAVAEQVFYCIPDEVSYLGLVDGEFASDARRTSELERRFTVAFVESSDEPSLVAAKLSTRSDELPCYLDMTESGDLRRQLAEKGNPLEVSDHIDCQTLGAGFAFNTENNTFIYRGERLGLVTHPYTATSSTFTKDQWENSIGYTGSFMAVGSCETF